jgi:hypothetical protein
MTFRGSHAFPVAVLAAALSAGAGCAKDATSLDVTVLADSAVPPILILKSTVATHDSPPRASTSERSSNYEGDAGDRPGPFVFPLQLSLTVDSSLAGFVTITVEGIDWDTHAVTATAATSGALVAGHRTVSLLTLSPVPSGGGADGGTD